MTKIIQTTESTETRRMHRARLAEKLLTQEAALNTTVGWEDLEQLPFWCALPEPEVQQLITRCGLSLYSQTMQHTIDGHLHNSFLALTENTNYHNIDTQRFLRLPTPLPATVESYVNTAGAALLLSTIGDNPCKAAIGATLPCAPMIAFDLTQAQATEVLKLVLEQPKASEAKDTQPQERQERQERQEPHPNTTEVAA